LPPSCLGRTPPGKRRRTTARTLPAAAFIHIFQHLRFGKARAIHPGEEGKKMKKTIAMMMLLAGGLFAAPRISVGIGFGAPASVVVARPANPGPGYTWVGGYYAPNGVWVAGYWAPPVFRENVCVYERDHDRYNDYFRDRDAHFDRDHDRGQR
jgi:hypothetical protein